MTFDKFLEEFKKLGGTQKGFGIDIGISEPAMSRLVHRKGRVGLRMINRIVAASRGRISAKEAIEDFRPDIYNAIMTEGTNAD